MIEFVTKLLEVMALLIRAWIAAKSDAKASELAVKEANQKLAEIAAIVENRMRELNRADKQKVQELQDEMDADLS